VRVLDIGLGDRELALDRFGRRLGDPLYGAAYGEGCGVLASGMVFDHGRLEVADRIIDPSMWDSCVAYFAGPRWTPAEAEREAEAGIHGSQGPRLARAQSLARLYAQRVREGEV
jgi:hypothetical protein